MRRRCPLLGAAVALVLFTFPPSTLAHGWSIQPGASTTGGATGSLSAVACPSASTCIAVGDFLSAERSPAGWSSLAVRLPHGFLSGSLTGVACSGAQWCVAVGSATEPSGDIVPLLENWDGRSWTASVAPVPAGSGNTELSGVSCAGPSACVAVGSRSSASSLTPVAEWWNGQSWSLLRQPSTAAGSYLTGVACPAASSCELVGAAGSQALIERWDGSTLTVENPPGLGLSGLGATQLAGISCTSASSCIAVGSYQSLTTSDTAEPYAASFDGSRWTEQSVPSTAPSGTSEMLESVSCASASSCTAVGDRGGDDPDGTATPVASHWNGGSWSTEGLPSPSGRSFVTLSGVACPMSEQCIAVGAVRLDVHGSQPELTLGESWNGSGWSIEATPDAGARPLPGALASVSCSAATSCTAVGDLEDPTAQLSPVLIEHWDGSRWRTQSSAVLPGQEQGASLLGVSCPSRDVCVAVGDGGASERPPAEVWDGSGWRATSVAVPSSAKDAQLTSVACSAPKDCTAVGEVLDSTARLLVERWNGTRWSEQQIRTPAGFSADFTASISCTGGGRCMIVGAAAGGAGWRPFSFSETRSGGSWSSRTVPNPRRNSALEAVSCPAADSCTAVGLTEGSLSSRALTEHWNGRRWTVEITPQPRVRYAGLLAVSCPARGLCYAVGASGRPVAEAGTGRAWMTQQIPASADHDDTLSGLACANRSSCIAVGDRRHAAAGHAPLIEAFTGPAPAPLRRPRVEMFGAFRVQRTSAHLNAAVDPRGWPLTRCIFEWGPTRRYGRTVRCARTPRAAGGMTSVSAVVRGLIPGRTYHYRLVAVNAAGRSVGADRRLTTAL